MKRFFDYFVGSNDTSIFHGKDDVKFSAYQPQSNSLIIVYRSSIEQIDVSTKESRWNTKQFDYSSNIIHHCALLVQNLIITGDHDGTVRVYEASTGDFQFMMGRSSVSNIEPVSNINPLLGYGHSAAICHIVPVSSDYIITGSNDGTARLWNIVRRVQEQVYFTPTSPDPTTTDVTKRQPPAPVTALAYDDIRQIVSIGYANGVIRQYQRTMGNKVLELGKKGSRQVTSLCVLTRTDFLILSNSNDITRIWDLSATVEHSRLNQFTSCMCYDSTNDIFFSASLDGELVLRKGVMDSEVDEHVHDRSLLELKRAKMHTSEITSIWYHPKEDVLITCSRDRNVVMWKAIVQNAINQLDSKVKKLVLSDIDIQVRNLDQIQVNKLMEELREKPEIPECELPRTNVEKRNLALVIGAFSDQCQVMEEEEGGADDEMQQLIHSTYSALKQKAEHLEQYIEVEIRKHTSYLADSRETLFQQYKSYIEPFDKEVIRDMEANFRRELKELEMKHKEELQNLKKQYKDLRIKFDREKRRQNQKAAKAYRTAKNIYKSRVRELDVTGQSQIREAITSINTCGDCNSDEYYALDGRYKLLHRVHMRTDRVFVAVDLVKRRIVAIKVLPAGLSIANNLIHPGLVPVREIIASDMHTFVIMKRMNYNLRQILNSPQHSLTVLHDEGQVAKFIYKLIQGLKYLRNAGVVHRELRPETVLVSINSSNQVEPHLFHVGLMKAVVGQEKCEDGVTYSAPELFCKSIYLESDIWSLGCLAVRMLQTPEERQSSPLIRGNSMDDILKDMIAISRPSDMEMNRFCSEVVKKDVAMRKHLEDLRSNCTTTSNPGTYLTRRQLLKDQYMRHASEIALEFVEQCLQFPPWVRPRYEQLEQLKFFQTHGLQ